MNMSRFTCYFQVLIRSLVLFLILTQFNNSYGATVYVIGSGGVGTLLSASLSSKNKVNVVVRSSSKPRNIQIPPESQKAMGSTIEQHTLSLMDWQSFDAFEKDSFVLITVKAGDVKEVSRLVASKLDKDKTQTIVFLQNGINILQEGKELASYKKAVRSMVLVGVNVTSDKTPVLKVNSKPKVTLASKSDPAALRAVESLMAGSGFEVAHTTDNVPYIEWKKALLNIYINGLTAICDLKIGEVLENGTSAFFAKQLLSEAAKVANVEGATFTQEEINNIEIMAQGLKAHSTSMREDIRHGRKTEAMWIYGHMIKVAKKAKIRVPAAELVFNLIEGLERNETSPAVKEVCGTGSSENRAALDPTLRNLLDEVYAAKAPKSTPGAKKCKPEEMLSLIETSNRKLNSKGVAKCNGSSSIKSNL